MGATAERTVRLPADLHARPAGKISKAAAAFAAAVRLASNGREVDARSVLLVMSLGATKDTEVTVRATGDDADRAVETLSEMLASVTPIEPGTSG